ncbi:hypothetical protein PMZ66_13115 [Clostridium paraputrificum]|uniref:hypothetical protein n=1 Tax=Clostridium paraputrificum TaxID=29363 RepID=UPI00232E1D09|nr:hypothetical protein [Clostridium paraputrificum]MDB2076551.1 hypothetical protein [Clostridium paraputrificum]MDB2080068.1 hypothetical protein [Clostridium paraputrificum]
MSNEKINIVEMTNMAQDMLFSRGIPLYYINHLDLSSKEALESSIKKLELDRNQLCQSTKMMIDAIKECNVHNGFN